MSRPASTPFAEAAYSFLEPVAESDEALGWPLLVFVIALSRMFQPVEDIVRSTGGKPAGSQVLDVDRCPAVWLPWLAQFVGQDVPDGTSEADARAIIRDEPSFRRGMVSTLTAAVQATLDPSSSRYVAVSQRVGGDAAQIQVSVRTAQVVNASLTLAAALAAKRAGLLLTLVSTAHMTYAEMETAFAAGSYLSAESTYPTYALAEAA